MRKLSGTTAAPRTILDELNLPGIHNVIVVRAGNEPAFAHSHYLAQARQLPDSSFRRVMELSHGGRPGTTEVYVSTRHTKPDLNALRQQGIPAKFSNAINPQL